MKNDENVPSLFRLVALDISTYAKEKFVKQCGGKVWAIFLYNKNEHTYCCETTPSYCLYFLRLEPQAYPNSDDETFFERFQNKLDIIGTEMEQISYYHTYDIDRLPENHFEDVDHRDFEDIEEAMEYCRGNHFSPDVVGR